MNNTVNKELYERISKKSYEGLCNMAGSLLLHPNDMIEWNGSIEKFNQKKEVFEAVLEDMYKDTDLYKYYYELPTIKHGFCTFGRWENGMYF